MQFIYSTTKIGLHQFLRVGISRNLLRVLERLSNRCRGNPDLIENEALGIEDRWDPCGAKVADLELELSSPLTCKHYLWKD